MNYLDYNYPKDESGLNQYPQKLCNYLVKRYGLKGKLLDIGAGRGTHCICFWRNGLDCVGVDKPYDFNEDLLPARAGEFDVVFTKSLIEHIHNTGFLLSEIARVLKPGGLVICLIPDWETDYKMFYDDPTHVRPFTQKGLKQAFVLAGFKDVQVKGFYQLPFLWRWKWLTFLVGLLKVFPDGLKYNKKGEQRVWVRHSKERMILLSAGRP